MLISTLIPTAKSSQQRSTWKSPVIQNVQDPQKMSLAYALFGYTSPELTSQYLLCQNVTSNFQDLTTDNMQTNQIQGKDYVKSTLSCC